MPSFDAPTEWFEDKLVFEEGQVFHIPVQHENGLVFAFREILDEETDEVLPELFEVNHEYQDEGSQPESDQEVNESPNTSSFEISDMEDSSNSSEYWWITENLGTLPFSASETAEDQVNLEGPSEVMSVTSSSPEIHEYSNSEIFEDMINIETDQETINSEMMIETPANVMEMLEDERCGQEELGNELEELGNELEAMGKALNKLTEDINM